jgi:hypothetical protein
MSIPCRHPQAAAGPLHREPGHAALLAAQHAAAPGLVGFSTAGGAVLGAGPTCKVCAGRYVLCIYCVSTVYILCIYCVSTVYLLSIFYCLSSI